MDCLAEPLDFGQVPMHPSEVLGLEFDWLAQLAHFWEGGEFYRVDDVRRPTRANGYAFHCVVEGQSDAREPRWIAREGLRTYDGSVEWVAHRANFDGMDRIQSATASAEGLTLGSITWSADEVLVPVSGATDGEDYEVLCEIDTESGQHLVGRMTIKARAKKAHACA